jgi:DNA-directed RNA polymerase specialized sigma24 family protein
MCDYLENTTTGELSLMNDSNEGQVVKALAESVEKRVGKRLDEVGTAQELFPLVYDELVKIAENVDFTKRTDPGSLVNALWIKWHGSPPSMPMGRADLVRLARTALRNLFFDRFRAQQHSVVKVSLEDRHSSQTEIDYSVVEDILKEMEGDYPDLVSVLTYKIYTKFTDDEIASDLEVSEATEKRYFAVGKEIFKEKLKRRPI